MSVKKTLASILAASQLLISSPAVLMAEDLPEDEPPVATEAEQPMKFRFVTPVPQMTIEPKVIKFELPKKEWKVELVQDPPDRTPTIQSSKLKPVSPFHFNPEDDSFWPSDFRDTAPKSSLNREITSLEMGHKEDKNATYVIYGLTIGTGAALTIADIAQKRVTIKSIVGVPLAVYGLVYQVHSLGLRKAINNTFVNPGLEDKVTKANAAISNYNRRVETFNSAVTRLKTAEQERIDEQEQLEVLAREPFVTELERVRTDLEGLLRLPFLGSASREAINQNISQIGDLVRNSRKTEIDELESKSEFYGKREKVIETLYTSISKKAEKKGKEIERVVSDYRKYLNCLTSSELSDLENELKRSFEESLSDGNFSKFDALCKRFDRQLEREGIEAEKRRKPFEALGSYIKARLDAGKLSDGDYGHFFGKSNDLGIQAQCTRDEDAFQTLMESKMALRGEVDARIVSNMFDIYKYKRVGRRSTDNGSVEVSVNGEDRLTTERAVIELKIVEHNLLGRTNTYYEIHGLKYDWSMQSWNRVAFERNSESLGTMALHELVRGFGAGARRLWRDLKGD